MDETPIRESKILKKILRYKVGNVITVTENN